MIDTIESLVKTQGALAVMGNHDEAALRGDSASMREDARQVLAWTHAQLDARQLDFLASLPLSQQQGECLYVHANAFAPKDWEYITGRIEAMRSLHATNARYTFCGHMHEPMLYHLSGTGKAGDFKPEPGVTIPLLSHRQWLVIRAPAASRATATRRPATRSSSRACSSSASSACPTTPAKPRHASAPPACRSGWRIVCWWGSRAAAMSKEAPASILELPSMAALEPGMVLDDFRLDERLHQGRHGQPLVRHAAETTSRRARTSR